MKEQTDLKMQSNYKVLHKSGALQGNRKALIALGLQDFQTILLAECETALLRSEAQTVLMKTPAFIVAHIKTHVCYFLSELPLWVCALK